MSFSGQNGPTSSKHLTEGTKCEVTFVVECCVRGEKVETEETIGQLAVLSDCEGILHVKEAKTTHFNEHSRCQVSHPLCTGQMIMWLLLHDRGLGLPGLQRKTVHGPARVMQ